ncbi:ARM repeat-containing protein [Lichtheimia hyalospora FSU 10163]|nr:ARM repeat-containing protein [Lichtheimia hyalospora FSU 10163]
MADLGFDFSDEHDDFDVVNTVFSADDNAAKRESSPPRDNNQEHPTIPNQQHNETQVNGTFSDDQGEDEKTTRIQDTSEEHKEKDPYNDLDSPAGSYADDYNDTDEYLEPTAPEGFGSDSLIQVMSEEVSADDLEDELIMDESLSPMERIYLFNKSDMLIHRLLVAKELPNTIYEISVSEAVNYVLPMVLKIAIDHDDTVRESFVSELDKIIMFYYTHAPPLLDKSGESSNKLVEPTSSGPLQQQRHDEPDTISVPAPAVDAETSTLVDHDTTETEATQHDQSLESEQSDQHEQSASYVNEHENAPQPETQQSAEFDQKTLTADFEPKTLAADDLHIPQYAFAPLLIEFLLDQNSSLASLGQQCIVSVASELASKAKHHELYRDLLDTEIFEGVVLGLMAIVDGKPRQGDYDQALDNHEKSSADEMDQGEINLAKMMCLSLISALAGVLGPERCTSRCLPLIERMSNDPMFYVRKEAAAAIGNLATVVDHQVAIDRLLPLYQNFSRDTIWHVRRSCVLTLPLLCGVLPDETRAQIAVDGVKLFKNDVSRNVRNTLAEVIGELIAKFLPEDWETTGKPGKVPEALLEYFLSLGPSTGVNQMYKSETDRAIICAYNFPAVVLTAGADYWDSHLKDTYLSLTKDYQIKVRRTFAYSLHEIARIIGPDRTERDLVQIFALYLMDLDDVKQGVLEHLAEFLGTLAVSSRNEYIPILAEVWDGVMTNWRLRDILAGQLRDIALLFDAARVVEHILPLAIRACQDEFAAVRETGVESFPIILDIVKRAVDEDGETLSQADPESDDNTDSRREFALALLNHVMEKLDEFVRSESYRGRLIFVQICKVLLEAGICAADFASFFLPRLIPLAKDPVVNVRIATARAFRTIQMHAYRHELTDLMLSDNIGEHDTPSELNLEQMLYQLALDTDADVRSFVSDLVDQQRLEQCRNELKAMETEPQNMGTPMQGIEGASRSPSPEIASPAHNDDIERERTPDDEVTMTSAGTPMDCSVESDESNSDHETSAHEHDEDGDETMTEVEKHDDDDHSSTRNDNERMPSPPQYQPSLAATAATTTTTTATTTTASTSSTEDKERDEYVYLSKSMLHQDEISHSGSSSNISPQSSPNEIA